MKMANVIINSLVYLLGFILCIQLIEFILSFFTWRVWPLRLFGVLRYNPVNAFWLILSLLILAIICPLIEPLWRIINGVRPLRLNNEKDRLYPLFKEVYKEARKKNTKLHWGIKLYIQEDIEINAFAFGMQTLILTKGSVMLLSDEDIKGLIAHELGHFANGDTLASLITALWLLPFSLLMMFFDRTKPKVDEASKKSFFVWFFKSLYDFFYYIFKIIQFISELIIMHLRRRNEYRADMYALTSGYGAELAEVLNNLYEISLNKTGTIKEMMMRAHPHITKRIERLEIKIGRQGNREMLKHHPA